MGQGQAAGPPGVPQPLAEHDQIESEVRHVS